jgi:hypothetical protein
LERNEYNLMKNQQLMLIWMNFFSK